MLVNGINLIPMRLNLMLGISLGGGEWRMVCIGMMA